MITRAVHTGNRQWTSRHVTACRVAASGLYLFGSAPITDPVTGSTSNLFGGELAGFIGQVCSQPQNSRPLTRRQILAKLLGQLHVRVSSSRLEEPHRRQPLGLDPPRATAQYTMSDGSTGWRRTLDGVGPSLPGSSALMSLAGRATEAVERALSLLPRIAETVTIAEALIERVNSVVAEIETTVHRAQAVVERTEVVVEQAAALTQQLAPLMEQFHPTLTQLHPILDRITETTQPDEVAAVVEMLNLTPDLVTKLRNDIIPVLDTMGTVAPDVRDLLDVSRGLNGMLAGLPGLGRIKRRVEDEKETKDTYRADEEPPSSPDRG